MPLSPILSAMLLGASSSAPVWPAAPFVPEIVFDASDGALCSAYSNDIQKEFFSAHPEQPDTTPNFSLPLEFADELADVADRPNETHQITTVSNGRYLGDIDGDGSEDEVFVQTHYSSNAEGNRALLTLTKLTKLEVQALRQEWQQLTKERIGGLPEERRKYYRLFRTDKRAALEAVKRFGVSTGSKVRSWETFDTPPREPPEELRLSQIAKEAFRYIEPFWLIEYDGRLYGDAHVEARWLRSRDRRSTESHRVLLSFDRDMRPKAECIVTWAPDRKGLVEPPEVKAFVTNAVTLEGAEGVCHGGTLNPWGAHSREREWILLSVQTTPWRLFTPNRFPAREFFTASQRTRAKMRWLEVWKLLGAWNAQAYDQAAELQETTRLALAAYYIDFFAVSPILAETWAANAVDAILASSTLGASDRYAATAAELDRVARGTASNDDFLVIAKSISWRKSEQQVLDQAFRLAVAANARRSVLNGFLTQGASIDSGNESALMQAVGRPSLLKFLLSAGADPNRPNVFGKTPLMMAVHLDQGHSARLLLQAGADPNAATLAAGDLLPKESGQYKSANTCDYRIHYGNRTPLMYAAENSSLAVMRLLLRQGASATVRDDGGRGVLHYLSQNTALNGLERSRAQRMLERVGAEK